MFKFESEIDRAGGKGVSSMLYEIEEARGAGGWFMVNSLALSTPAIGVAGMIPAPNDDKGSPIWVLALTLVRP